MDTTPRRDRTRWARTLIGVEIVIWDRLDSRLQREFALPIVQYELLRFLERAGTEGLRVGSLAKKLHMTVGGVSKLTDRMVAADLVDRTSDGADRRASRIILTAVAHTILPAAHEAYEDELALLLDPVVSCEEWDAMRSLLERIRGEIGPP